MVAYGDDRSVVEMTADHILRQITLAEADEVWLPPIYFARDSEEECRRVTSEDLAARIRNEGGDALTLPDLEAVIEYGAPQLRERDVVVTMGAGNVDEVAYGLARRLR